MDPSVNPVLTPNAAVTMTVGVLWEVVHPDPLLNGHTIGKYVIFHSIHSADQFWGAHPSNSFINSGCLSNSLQSREMVLEIERLP
jgi:hypothetical protein